LESWKLNDKQLAENSRSARNFASLTSSVHFPVTATERTVSFVWHV